MKRLYRGFPAVVAGAIPSHAVHYATYEVRGDTWHTDRTSVYIANGGTVGVCDSHLLFVRYFLSSPLSLQHLKHRLGGSEPGHHPLINGISGGLATMAHDAIITPLDVVKQRLQMYHSSYSGVWQCIRTVFAQEGLRAFYASYPTTVAMNVPFQAVHFAAYESFKILFTGDGEFLRNRDNMCRPDLYHHTRSMAVTDEYCSAVSIVCLCVLCR